MAWRVDFPHLSSRRVLTSMLQKDTSFVILTSDVMLFMEGIVNHIYKMMNNFHTLDVVYLYGLLYTWMYS